MKTLSTDKLHTLAEKMETPVTKTKTGIRFLTTDGHIYEVSTLDDVTDKVFKVLPPVLKQHIEAIL